MTYAWVTETGLFVKEQAFASEVSEELMPRFANGDPQLVPLEPKFVEFDELYYRAVGFDYNLINGTMIKSAVLVPLTEEERSQALLRRKQESLEASLPHYTETDAAMMRVIIGLAKLAFLKRDMADPRTWPEIESSDIDILERALAIHSK